MIVAIYACENKYQGLHGIYHKEILEVTDLQEAIEYAEEESFNVMNSYSNIMEEFYSDAKYAGCITDSEYNDFVEQCIEENMMYQIWEVQNAYASIAEMLNDFDYHEDVFFEKANCIAL